MEGKEEEEKEEGEEKSNLYLEAPRNSLSKGPTEKIL